MRVFMRLNEVGVTLAIASHDLGLIEQMDMRRISLDDGVVVD